MNLSPQIKATITLPFVILAIGAVLYFLFTYQWVLPIILATISTLAILGSLWYGLYTFFGGED